MFFWPTLRSLSLTTALCLLPVLSVLICNTVRAEWIEHDTAIMGSNIHIEFWAKENGPQLLEKSLKILHGVDERMNPLNKHSELYLINQQAFQQAIPVSDELYGVIEKAQFFAQLSDGAFDISFASVGLQYDYRNKIQPTSDTIKDTLQAIDYRAILLDKKTQTIRFTHPQLKIDLGGIAKGHGVDSVYDYLKEQGIKHALITAGGDSRILGDRRGTPWIVGIKHPRATQQQILRMPLEDVALSTSGDYERFFIADGKRYHHILNPATGHSPLSSIQSVSILADDSTTADALSTTVFVLGIEKGLALINKLDNIDVIIITAGGNFHYSAGLQQLQ